MSSINERLAIFTLFFLMALAAVLIGTDTSVAINDVGTLHYHDSKFLPGTPPLKKGYEQTAAGIKPIIEKHEPRVIPVSRDALGGEI